MSDWLKLTEGLQCKVKEMDCSRLAKQQKVIDSLEKEKEELIHKLENMEAAITTMEKDVEWHKGQVDAYQYCMNCRR